MIETQLLQSLLPLEIVISLLFIITAYLVIKLPRSYKLKLIIIPLLVVGSFFTFSYFADTLGYPVHQTPGERIIVLDYRVNETDQGKFIEIWTLPFKQSANEERSRLIAIPWTKEQEEQLRNAKRNRGQSGQLIVGELKKRMNRQGRPGSPFFEFKNLSPKFFSPKHNNN